MQKVVKLAVIGRDVSQSASPPIHNFVARELGRQISYERISIAEEDFEREAERLFSEYDGFNVTIPYKLAIMSKLDNYHNDAVDFGAVNTVLTATRSGFNTDGVGFVYMLKANGIDVEGKRVLVLGAGGAGRSAVKKLLDGGAFVELYSRTFSKSLELQRQFPGVKALESVSAEPRYLIVNATGVGMHDSVGVSPISEDIIAQADVAVDLIYVPPRSEFLRIAEGLGKQIVNGHAMLFYQAYFADCIFFGLAPKREQATALYNKYLKINI